MHLFLLLLFLSLCRSQRHRHRRRLPSFSRHRLPSFIWGGKSKGMSVWVSGKLRMEKTRKFEREVETLIHAVEKIAKLKIPLLIGIAFNEAIIEERKQGIQEIQQQISEVNEIFKDLAVLVHDKGAIINDIGSNIENCHAATVQATSHLVKASKTQRSNSSLTCFLLVIFGVILIIVIIVVVA
ncbi:hypothetical protein ACFX1Z_024643 [Malus domestica]